MIEQTEHTIALPGLSESLQGLRIVHLTDIHRSSLTSDRLLHRAVEVANAARPDLILMTGDYVTENPKDIEPCAHILSALHARLGVYAILGNHDYRAGARAMQKALEKNGTNVLINRSVCIENSLYLIGIDDDRDGHPDLHQAYAAIPKEVPTITLIHNPAIVERISDRPGLVLAGHTHGGQVVVPVLTAWKVRSIRAKHYNRGWFTVGKSRLYVNRGLGNVGVSFRFRARPEIALFTLTP